jgi:hypothetical protein
MLVHLFVVKFILVIFIYFFIFLGTMVFVLMKETILIITLDDLDFKI